MKSNRIIWGLVALVVLITIAVSFGTKNSHSQQGNSNKQDNKGYEDLSKYAVVDYDAPEPTNATEREERKLKNKRYDNQDWVLKNPHPDDSGVGRYDEQTPPPLIPADESNLVIVGKIVKVTAHLSNDKLSVYSEFTIRVEQILKNDVSREVKQEEFIIADRAGGYVRYPNGQKVLYRLSERGLPKVGSEYVFFLTSDKQNPNYEILTLYGLKDARIIQLDYGRKFDDFKNASKQNFIEAVRNKISESSTSKEPRREP